MFTDKTQDITTSRPNTLYDNADDIQRQLDSEARDRIKFGRVWIDSCISYAVGAQIITEGSIIKKYIYTLLINISTRCFPKKITINDKAMAWLIYTEKASIP